MQTLHGLGQGTDIFSSILSSVGASVTPEIQAEVEQIVVPVIAPYLIGLVMLSFIGLAVGISANKKVNRLIAAKGG
jgi:hypothetical protein